MGVPKGTDNFAKSRAKSVAANLELIRRELDKQKKRRIPYPDLRALVADISERTGLHRTTLTRKGSKYLKVLLLHLAEQPGASANVSDNDATPALLKAKLLDARLEVRTLKNRLEVAEHKSRAKVEPNGEASALDTVAASPNWYLAFADTATVLKLLIDRMNAIDETVQVDVEGKRIIDLSVPSKDRIVAGPERARWFADYYKKLKEQENGGKGEEA
ncbi:hypothetical protein BCh11DRAFT_05627 [Burkholderia sp. Ch1-1]|nr:hypothetical protein BCh11DRAFT_05627 [Burkholderia sp. Ch1-1]